MVLAEKTGRMSWFDKVDNKVLFSVSEFAWYPGNQSYDVKALLSSKQRELKNKAKKNWRAGPVHKQQGPLKPFSII